MKLLSIAIPCYNSSLYMRKCIDSLLPGGEDVEIIIVNDGSADNTPDIAEEYRQRFPGIVKVVKEGEKRRKVMKYHHALPQDEIFTWRDVRHFRVGQYILMHSVIYRTNLLRDCGLKLPENTFYVDNIFVFNPLPYVRTMYYMDVNFYRYFIGRADQSVNEQVMIGRIDQQIRVNKLMVDYYVAEKQHILANGKVRKYMVNYLDIITTVSSVLLIRSGIEENLEKKKELWQYIKSKDKVLWARLRMGLLGNAMNLPGKLGRKITVDGYKICQRIFHFN